MKTKKKNGISLIVLIITIIVMIILAGAIVLTLNNNGIIDRANEAVKEYNLDEVEQVASLAWAEAYLNGVRTKQDLEKAVKDELTANKITEADYDGYILEVTENGVALEKIIAPGLYESGSNYSVMKIDWETLLNDYGIVVSNGVVSTYYNNIELDADLVLPSDGSISSIGDNAFEMATEMISVVIPSSVRLIGESAFSDTRNMSSITIPSNVTSIGEWAFGYSSLRNIIFKGTELQWKNIVKAVDWNAYCGEITVTCTDGTVVIPAWTE